MSENQHDVNRHAPERCLAMSGGGGGRQQGGDESRGPIGQLTTHHLHATGTRGDGQRNRPNATGRCPLEMPPPPKLPSRPTARNVNRLNSLCTERAGLSTSAELCAPLARQTCYPTLVCLHGRSSHPICASVQSVAAGVGLQGPDSDGRDAASFAGGLPGPGCSLCAQAGCLQAAPSHTGEGRL